MAVPRPSLLHATLLGLSLAVAASGSPMERVPRRIVSFHAPSSVPSHANLLPAPPVFSPPHHLQPLVPAEPAPVREEQNEPPPPDSRARGRASLAPLQPTPGMTNPPGFAAMLASQFGVQPARPIQPPVNESAQAAPGVVQVVTNVIPNAPPRIVLPPPAEMLPVQDIQPISLDPQTGQPRRIVDPKFRAKFLTPNAPPIMVPVPNMVMFGKGFGGAPIVDVSGVPVPAQPAPIMVLPAAPALPAAQPQQAQISVESSPQSGSTSFQSFHFGIDDGSSQSSQSFSMSHNPVVQQSSPAQSSSLSLPSAPQEAPVSQEGTVFSVQSFGASGNAEASPAQAAQSSSSGSSTVGSSLAAALASSGESAVSMSVSSQNLPGHSSSFSNTVFH